MSIKFSRKIALQSDNYSDFCICLQNYRKRRENLISLTLSTISLFNRVSDSLNSEIVQCFNTKNLLELVEELGLIEEIKSSNITNVKTELQIENPAIAILGQIKAGKSTFVNTLMAKNVVYQCFDLCTSRVTRIYYHHRNYLQLIDESGNVVKKRNLSSYTIPKQYLKLSDESRQDPREINKLVKVGINIDFLKFGIDIIDTPGLDGSYNVTKLVSHLKKGVLPIVVYVINGRAGVKQTDTRDILELKTLLPNIEIIYFVTHLDTSDMDEHSSMSDPIDVVNYKMDLSFRKLQHHNFIPQTYKNWFDCPYFHGSSLHGLIDYSKNVRTTESLFYFKQYNKFFACLLKQMSSYFENKIFESCEILMNFQMDISAKIINYTQNFALKNKENYNQISSIKEIEAQMYSKIKYSINDSKQELISRLMARLEKESIKDIVDPIKDTIYPSSIEVPENGIVDDPIILDQCQVAIMKVMILGIENILKNFVEEELFKNYREALNENIFHSITEISLKRGKSCYEMCLGRILTKQYKLNRISSMSPDGGQVIVIEFMNVVLSSIKTFLSKGLITKLKENEVDVKSPLWKLKQAEEYLKRCDHHLLAENVCKGLFEDFEMKHNQFLKTMESETLLIAKKIQESVNTTNIISDEMPNIFMLFMETLNIKCKYFFDEISDIENITQGPKSKIFKCILKDEEIAMKKISLDVYSLNNISEEIFHSQQLSHYNLQTTFGISISEDKKHISILYPLKKIDLGNYMKYNIINSEDLKLISFQIADTLQYLHNQDILHKDLKLTNILIDEYANVTISDYGYCKSEALTKHLQIGSPIHIAPEVRLNGLFTKKTDIYAYGIILWYLFEGTGKIPKNAVYVSNGCQVVWDKYKFQSNNQMKPEKLKKFPDDIWNLMEKCWNYDPNDRPDIDKIISELNLILKLNN